MGHLLFYNPFCPIRDLFSSPISVARLTPSGGMGWLGKAGQGMLYLYFVLRSTPHKPPSSGAQGCLGFSAIRCDAGHSVSASLRPSSQVPLRLGDRLLPMELELDTRTCPAAAGSNR